MVQQEEMVMMDRNRVRDNTDWQQRFREIYDRAVETYEEGRRGAESLFSPEDTAFFVSIGAQPQELYDFVEDWFDVGEPSYDTVLRITAVRREYFLTEQNGQPSPTRISVNSLPPMQAQLGGFTWLPRIIEKAKAKLKGEMPPELMYSCGGDRPFLRNVGIDPAEFLRLVWRTDGDQKTILRYVKEQSDKATHMEHR